MAKVHIVESSLCRAYELGLVSYGESWQLQNSLVASRIASEIPDTILFLQHFPTITIGASGREDDIIVSVDLLHDEGISVFYTDHGGGVTYHGPGQLVVYPILNLKARGKDIHQYVRDLEEVIIRTLAVFSIQAHIDPQYPGVWVGQDKIGTLGIRVSRWVTKHGLALNVNVNLKHFSYIIPCGITDRQVTSMSRLLGHDIPLKDVTSCLLEQFAKVFNLEVKQESVGSSVNTMPVRRPAWLIKKAPSTRVLTEMKTLLDGFSLHTVCESARCPNLGECFSRHTATFLLMGDICTRNCRFCAVKKGKPSPLDPDEPGNVVQAVGKLGLKHVVITSVTRDDLPDGGASHFARAVEAIHSYDPGITVEVLIPDFQGSPSALEVVVASCPTIINHNVETVPRLYPQVRPQADYQRSLQLLKQVKPLAREILTKSGLMVGLGEGHEEVIKVMEDLRGVDCDLLTIGQYLQPSINYHEVVRFAPPQEFEEYKEIAVAMGFRGVASAPYVRSSFQADRMLKRISLNEGLMPMEQNFR